MQLDATIFASAQFVDRKGREAQVSGHLPTTLTADDAFARWDAIVAAMAAISSAVIPASRLVWRYRVLPAPAFPIDADCARRVMFFYRNGGQVSEYFEVPSPAPWLFETSGFYSGIRVDTDNPDVVAAIDLLSASLSQLLTPEGEPWPPNFVVGGLAE